jgi:translation elongation factor EF-G
MPQEPNPDTIDATNPSNSFVVALSQMEYGNLIPDASEQLSKLVSKVMTVRRKGKFTLVIDVIPGKGDSGQIKVETEIKVSNPKAEKGESIFFGTAQGQLLRKDPRQKEFAFEQEKPRPVAFAAGE